MLIWLKHLKNHESNPKEQIINSGQIMEFLTILSSELTLFIMNNPPRNFGLNHKIRKELD